MKIQLFGNSEQFKQRVADKYLVKWIITILIWYLLLVIECGAILAFISGTGHPLYSQNICERDLRLMMSALKIQKNLARIILMNYLSVFVTLEHLKNVCT